MTGEDALHFAVVDFLRIALPPEAVFHHSPNEGKRGPKAQMQLRRRGCRAGWPDLEIIWQGRFHAIELKAARGTVTANQRGCALDLAIAGVHVAVCRSLDEVVLALKGWSIPLRASLRAAS